MVMEQSECLRIPIHKAEIIRKQLLTNNLLRTDLKIKKNKKHVFLPINKENEDKNHLLKDFNIIISSFECYKKHIHDYKELVSIPDLLKNHLPSSFDIIGSIIIVRLDNTLSPYEKEIGDALLQTYSHIQSIYSINPIEGEFRTRRVKLIAGEKKVKTIHKEYNCTFYVDIKQTYFSPRLATERKYIASIIENDEIILDMFTGVAPFPIIISKFANPKQIVAIDKNKHAIALAQKNIQENNVTNKVLLYQTDAKQSPIIIKNLNVTVDRIIMNLPFKSVEFFQFALDSIYNNAIIHLYTICDENTLEQNIRSLIQIAKNQNFSLLFSNKRKIKSYSPHEFYMGINITAKKR